MDLSYYPGCTLTGSAQELDQSFRNAASTLGVNLRELPDWSCCGASSAHMVSSYLEYALPAKDLLNAERIGQDVVAPCAGCHVRMKAAALHIPHDPEMHRQFPVKGNINVLSGLDLFGMPNLVAKMKTKVTKSLEKLRLVPYYGCLAVRPVDVVEPSDPENPTEMDRILEALGAEVVKWPYKTDCCGGSLALTKTESVVKLSGKLLGTAKKLGADAVVTMCPMCQANLDTRQTDMSKYFGEVYHIPVLYVTEVIGMAFQDPQVKSWMAKHLVSPETMLKEKGLW